MFKNKNKKESNEIDSQSDMERNQVLQLMMMKTEIIAALSVHFKQIQQKNCIYI